MGGWLDERGRGGGEGRKTSVSTLCFYSYAMPMLRMIL